MQSLLLGFGIGWLIPHAFKYPRLWVSVIFLILYLLLESGVFDMVKEEFQKDEQN